MRGTVLVRSALADMGAVGGLALRLLWRHWPVLLALFLAGVVAHELLMRAAVKASATSAVLGAMILLLAPIATLVAFILMLRSLKPSLPWLSAASRRSTPDDGRGSLLNQLGSILVPFLSLYAAYSFLQDDFGEYAYRVWKDETLDNPEAITNPGSIDVLARLPYSPGVALVSVVVVALALRWVVDRWWPTFQRRQWLTLPVAYAETIWITLGVVVTGELFDEAIGWFETRRVVHWAYGLWYDVTAALGPLTEPVRDTGSWVWGVLTTSATDVIVIPIAWLVVGAVVYGHQIAPPPPLAVELYQRTRKRWPSAPVVVHRAGALLGSMVTGRFSAMIHGLRLVFRAGLFPMLLFCLAFVVAGGRSGPLQPLNAGAWLWELERLVIGPQELGSFWMPWSGPLDTLNSAVNWLLLACLLAAAIDWVLRVENPTHPTPAQPAADTSHADASQDGNQAGYPDVVSRA